VPLSYTWRLNERHYGALTGRNKRDCSQEYGLAQVQRWRRSVNEPPPPMAAGAAAALLDERAYRDVPKPLSESLDQCAERLRPFLEVELTAAMRKAVDECGFVAEQEGLPVEVPTFVVSASENVLRALVRELEELRRRDTADRRSARDAARVPSRLGAAAPTLRACEESTAEGLVHGRSRTHRRLAEEYPGGSRLPVE
jgi:bisphosphoglycerate-dependent phosphoglycerate mutase family 1